MNKCLCLLMTCIFLGVSYVQAQETESGASSGKEGAIHLNVGEGNFKKSLIALTTMQLLSTPATSKNHVKVGKDLSETLKFDLEVSGYFEFIKPSAFLEDVSKVGMKPKGVEANGFSFATWKQLQADFLIRSGYKITGNELTLETYLYYVPQAKLVFGKSYKAEVRDARVVAHTFANDIVKQLTGIRGIFLTKIVTARSTAKDQREIYVMDYDGNSPIAITHHQSLSNSPAWAPDGGEIAYRTFAYHQKDKSRNADLFVYQLATGKRWLVSYRPGINSGASYFPDGKHMVLTVSSGGNPDIYKMTTDGKSLTSITHGPNGAMNVEPSVSPDGSKIAFSSDRHGRPMIYVMDVDGSNVKRLTIAGDFNSTPHWSPDGKKIVFAGNDKGHWDLFLMDADGTNMSRLTSATRKTGKAADNADPSFAPDGQHVLFASNRTGHYQLYVIGVDGENEHRITFDDHDYYKPMWSPYID